MHRLQMGWWRSGRAPGSGLVTDGKRLIPSQLDSTPRPRALGLAVGGWHLAWVVSLSPARRCRLHGRSSGFWQSRGQGEPWAGTRSSVAGAGEGQVASLWPAGVSRGPVSSPPAEPCDRGGHSISARKVWMRRLPRAGDLGMDAAKAGSCTLLWAALSPGFP